MKTKEELNLIKEECKNVNKKLSELNEDELSEVLGGVTNYTAGLREGVMKTAKSLGDGHDQGSWKTMTGEQFLKWWANSNRSASEAVSNADGSGVYHDGTSEEASWRRN